MRTLLAFVLSVAFSMAASTDERVVATAKLQKSEDLPIAVESDALQRQFDALSSMRLDTLKYSRQGPVTEIVGDTGVDLPPAVTSLKEGDTDSAIVDLFGDVLLARGTESLRVHSHFAVGDSTKRTIKLLQSIRGIPVLNGGVALSYDDATKRVTTFVANFIPDRGLDTKPTLSAAEAESLVPAVLEATKESSEKDIEIQGDTHLAYYMNRAEVAPPKLVWVVRVQLQGVQWAYYVNAMTGIIVDRVAETQSLTRKVYDAQDQYLLLPSQLPAPMSQGDINQNPSALEAYTYILNADTKLRQRFPVQSGFFPTSTRQIIRFAHPFPNASHQIINNIDYITYSGLIGTSVPATTPSDVTYHEYSHGIAKRVFQFGTDTFDYEGAALHEGFADIAAATVQIASTGAITSATWKVAEGLFVPLSSLPVRSMANPTQGSYQQPSNDWYPLRAMGLNSGHFNSTILSHAYYLSIVGGQASRWTLPYIPDFLVPPLDFSPSSAEDRARQIYIQAFNAPQMFFEPGFMEMKTAAMDAALTMYGPAAQTSIKTAFEAVGVGYQCSAPPARPNPALTDLQCAGRFSVDWPSVPGADRYIVFVAPQLYGWPYGDVTTDGNVNHCMMQIASPSMLRARACNNCGCSEWSNTDYMSYQPGPCP